MLNILFATLKSLKVQKEQKFLFVTLSIGTNSQIDYKLLNNLQQKNRNS